VKPKQPEIEIDPETDDETAAAAPTEDIILHEAQKILLDYGNLLKGRPVVSQR
jgi:hypothetical protein